jgi:hypothetical protein
VRVLIVSKILVVAAYRRKLDEIAAQPGIDRLVVVTGPEWREPGGRALAFEPSEGRHAYELYVEPIWLNGSYHMFLWPRLGRIVREARTWCTSTRSPTTWRRPTPVGWLAAWVQSRCFSPGKIF